MTEIDLSSFSKTEKARLLAKIEKQTIKKAREDVNVFCEYVMQDEDGGGLKQADLHIEWQNLFMKEKKLVIVAPRDHGKTTQVVAHVLWRIGRDPNIRIKIVCQSDSNAKDRLSQVKQYIEDSEEYSKVFPHIKASTKAKDWTKHSITVARDAKSKDSTLEAWGVESSSTGGRADLIIFDDIVDESNALKHPSKRETIKIKFYNVWINQLGPDDELIYIGTRWHQDDLTGDLLKKDSYVSREYSIDEEFNPVWEEQWPKDALKERREDIGARAFDLGFRNEPISLEERTFDEDCLGLIQSDFDPNTYMQKYMDECPIVMGVDLAQSQRSAGASTVFFIVMLVGSTRYILDIRRGQWKSGRIVDELVHLNEFYQPSLIFVESNSFQETIINWVEAMTDEEPYNVPIEGVFTSTNKTDIEMGVPALASEMGRGLWKAPYIRKNHKDTCDSRQKCSFCDWYKELKDYPLGNSTDTVMANWFAMRAIWKVKQPGQDMEAQEKIAKELIRREHMDSDDSLIKPKGVLDNSVFH